jgi:uncharacterized membrane protein
VTKPKRPVQSSKAVARSKPNEPQILNLDANKPAGELSVVQQMMTFSGPLPPPQVLGMYDQVVPGMAERLVAAFESQQKHRHFLESAVVTGGITRSWFGIWFGFVISLVRLGVTAYAIHLKLQWAASVLGVGTLGSIVTTFITGRAQQEKERSERREKLLGEKKKK